MSDLSVLVLLAVFFGFGATMALTGFRRRSWGLTLLGVCLCSVPVGFASVVMASP